MAPTAVLLLLLAADAGASEPPARVVVVATGKTPALDAVAAEAEALARTHVAGRSGFAAVHATATTRAPDAILEEARALIEAGEGAYAELETKKAVRSLRSAISLLESELDSVGERELLVRALALLASVQNQSGHPQEAERTFLKLLALSPTHALDDSVFPPADVKLLERLQEDLAFTRPGTLEVTSGGVAASVWIDGRYRGTTPLTLENVEPGTHLWLVRRQGYLPARGTVRVDGERATVTAKLKAPASAPGLPGKVQRLVLERMNLHPTLFALADDLGSPDELLAVGLEEDPKAGPVVRLVRALPERAVLVGYREVSLGDGWQGRYTAALDELLDAPAVPELPPPALAAAPEPEPEPEGDGSALWWIAGTAGGVALAAAVVTGATFAIVSLTASGDDGAPPSSADDVHARARGHVLGYPAGL